MQRRQERIMSFKDRREAGRELAVALSTYSDQKPVILALPRGGVPVAAEVATALKAPLDLILVRKIGGPPHPELAMGAVVDGSEPIIVRNEDVIALAGIAESDFKAVCDSELAEIERRRRRYLGNRPRAPITGRTAIVIDDGVATGATTRAALRATRARQPRRLVLAVPVAPQRLPTVASKFGLNWMKESIPRGSKCPTLNWPQSIFPATHSMVIGTIPSRLPKRRALAKPQNDRLIYGQALITV